MSCSRSVCAEGTAACGVARPQPYSDTCNQPCVIQCPDSRVVIFPPPVCLTFPGAILTTFPQETVVDSAGTPAVASGYGGTHGAGALGLGRGACGPCGPC